MGSIYCLKLLSKQNYRENDILVSASSNKMITFIDLKTLKKVTEISLLKPCYTIRINSDLNILLASVNMGCIHKYDIRNLNKISETHRSCIYSYNSFSYAFDCDKQMNKVYFITQKEEKRLFAYFNFKNSRINFYPLHKGEILTIKYVSKTSLLFSSGRDCILKSTNLKSNKIIKLMEFKNARNIYILETSKNSKLLFIGTEIKKMLIMNLGTLQIIGYSEFENHVFSLAESLKCIYYSGWVSKIINCIEKKNIYHKSVKLN